MQHINALIIDAIEKILKQTKSKNYSPKIFSSVIYGVGGDGYYQIPYDGNVYTIPNGINIDWKPGQKVWVMIPRGELREMYILSANNT